MLPLCLTAALATGGCGSLLRLPPPKACTYPRGEMFFGTKGRCGGHCSRSLGEIAGFRRHSCAVRPRQAGKVAHGTHSRTAILGHCCHSGIQLVRVYQRKSGEYQCFRFVTRFIREGVLRFRPNAVTKFALSTYPACAPQVSIRQEGAGRSGYGPHSRTPRMGKAISCTYKARAAPVTRCRHRSL